MNTQQLHHVHLKIQQLHHAHLKYAVDYIMLQPSSTLGKAVSIYMELCYQGRMGEGQQKSFFFYGGSRILVTSS